jgi:hypothetical protein
MSKAHFNLSDFTSFVREKSLSRSNRFEVFINPPNVIGRSIDEAKQVSLLCEISNLPPINLSVKPFKIFGPSYQRPITSEYGGDGISMTFHIDRDMVLKRFFDDWIEGVVRRNDYMVNYQFDYTSTITIRQLDEQNNVTYEIELLEAFPRSITLVDLNHSAQNQTNRLNVIFAYRYWKRTDIAANRRVTSQVPVVPITIVPDLSLRTIGETETSRVLGALGGGASTDPNVDTTRSTFEVPSA